MHRKMKEGSRAQIYKNWQLFLSVRAVFNETIFLYKKQQKPNDYSRALISGIFLYGSRYKI